MRASRALCIYTHKELTHWKRPWCWVRLRVGGEGGDRGWDGWMASPTQWTWVEDEMVGWHHQLNGHEFEQVPGVGDGQGSLVWYSPWGCKKVRHDWVTELNWTQQSDKFSVGKFQVPTCIFQFLVRKWELRLLAFSVFLSHSQVF